LRLSGGEDKSSSGPRPAKERRRRTLQPTKVEKGKKEPQTIHFEERKERNRNVLIGEEANSSNEGQNNYSDKGKGGKRGRKDSRIIVREKEKAGRGRPAFEGGR